MSGGNPYNLPENIYTVRLFDDSLNRVGTYQIGVGDFIAMDFAFDEHGSKDFALYFSSWQNIPKNYYITIFINNTQFFRGVVREVSDPGTANGEYVYSGLGFASYLELVNTLQQLYTATDINTIVVDILDNLITPAVPITKNLANIDALAINVTLLQLQNDTVKTAFDDLRKTANSDGNDYVFGVDPDREFFFRARDTTVQATLVVGANGANGIADYQPINDKEDVSRLFTIGPKAFFNDTHATGLGGDVGEVQLPVPGLSETTDIDNYADGIIEEYLRNGRRAIINWKIEDTSPTYLIADGQLRIIGWNGIDDTLPIKEVKYVINESEKIREIKVGGIGVPETTDEWFLFFIDKVNEKERNTRYSLTNLPVGYNATMAYFKKDFTLLAFDGTGDEENPNNNDLRVVGETAGSSILLQKYTSPNWNTLNDLLFSDGQLDWDGDFNIIGTLGGVTDLTITGTLSGSGTGDIANMTTGTFSGLLTSLGIDLLTGGVANTGSIAGATNITMNGTLNGSTTASLSGFTTGSFTSTLGVGGLLTSSGGIDMNTSALIGATNITMNGTLSGSATGVLNGFTTGNFSGLLTASGGGTFGNAGLAACGPVTGVTTFAASGQADVGNLVSAGTIAGTGGTLTSLNLSNGGIINTGSIAGATTGNFSGLLSANGGATFNSAGLAACGSLTGAANITMTGTLSGSATAVLSGFTTGAFTSTLDVGGLLTASADVDFNSSNILNCNDVDAVSGDFSGNIYANAGQFYSSVLYYNPVGGGTPQSPQNTDTRIRVTASAVRNQEYSGSWSTLTQMLFGSADITFNTDLICTALDAGSGLIETNGNADIAGTLDVGGLLTASGGADMDTSSIVNATSIGCTSLNAGAGTIQTSGALQGGALTCTSANISSGGITNAGAISGATSVACTSLSCSGAITNVTTLNMSSKATIGGQVQITGGSRISVRTSAAQAGIAASTATTIQYNNEFYDNLNEFNTGAYGFTPSENGHYLIQAGAYLDSATWGAGEYVYIAIFIGASASPSKILDIQMPVGTKQVYLEGSVTAYVETTQTIYIKIYHTRSLGTIGIEDNDTTNRYMITRVM